MRIWALITVLIIFSLCISESPPETSPPTTTLTVTTPGPTTLPPTTTPVQTTPAPVNEELEWGKENGLTEDAISYMEKYDSNKKISPFEQIIGNTFDNLYKERNIPANTVVGILDIVIDEKESGIEYIMENIDTSVFKKMIEDDLIENHEKRLIDKSFTYSDLQNQLKTLNDKASENFLKTYKVVLDKSETGRTEPEKFLYEKIDEHLPEFKIGEDGFLYYGKERVLKVDDKNLYVKWLTKPYDPAYRKSVEIWEKRGCDWETGFDKEFSLCWSKFIGESTDIPWATKYYSVEPIEDKFKNTFDDACIRLKFDKFGFYGLGYDQMFDIYIYRLHTEEPRMRLFIEIPKSKEHFFDYDIFLYDKGTHINDDDSKDPHIFFLYENLYKPCYRRSEVCDRSFAELYYGTEFFWDYLKLAELIGPFEGNTPFVLYVPTLISPEPEEKVEESYVPTLISPEPEAILDNGRSDRKDGIIWDFEWTHCEGASKYQLYVIHKDAEKPVINVTVTDTHYHFVSKGSYTTLYKGWIWGVRAKIDGQWSKWSRFRFFNVEPTDTDPAS